MSSGREAISWQTLQSVSLVLIGLFIMLAVLVKVLSWHQRRTYENQLLEHEDYQQREDNEVDSDGVVYRGNSNRDERKAKKKKEKREQREAWRQMREERAAELEQKKEDEDLKIRKRIKAERELQEKEDARNRLRLQEEKKKLQKIKEQEAEAERRLLEAEGSDIEGRVLSAMQRLKVTTHLQVSEELKIRIHRVKKAVRQIASRMEEDAVVEDDEGQIVYVTEKELEDIRNLVNTKGRTALSEFGVTIGEMLRPMESGDVI